MILDLATALKGKRTQIKGKEYRSTEAYIEPFLEKMSKYTQDFRIQGIMAPQISLTEEGDINLEDCVYNRIWVQAVMPSDLCFHNHEETIGMIYALDTRKPLVKIYRGSLDKACLNTCIFNPSFLNVQELEPESAINYKPIDTIMAQTNDIKKTLEKLESIEVPFKPEIVNENLGKWVRNCLNMYKSDKVSGKVKVATSTAIDAYKLLYEKEDSRYYTNNDTTDLLNCYGAFTQILTDASSKEFVSLPEKTMLISNILGI